MSAVQEPLLVQEPEHYPSHEEDSVPEVAQHEYQVWAVRTTLRHRLPPRWVTRVVPHPTDPQAAWVTFSGLKWRETESHVFATTNGGAAWTDVSSNLPAVPVNGEPRRPPTVPHTVSY